MNSAAPHRFPRPPEGSWTEHYPELGTAPMSYEDCITPAVFDLEREAIFRRAWLMLDRVEQLPQVGSSFTKVVKAMETTVLVVRDEDEQVRAVHGPDRVPVHCEEWNGFIFVSFADQPEQSLVEFLGPLGARLDGYPFDRLTSRFSYKAEIKANWKLYIDAFQEFYHAPVLHASQSPDAFAHVSREAGFEGVHYELVGPHRMVTTSGMRPWKMPDTMLNPMEKITQSGLFGPWKPSGFEVPDTLNPPKIKAWGLDSYQFFPNFAVLTWSQGWVVTYQYWPTSYDSHIFEAHVYFPPATNARERVAQEMAAVTFKEYALQDSSTLEATQMMLESRAVTHFPLNDQEVLCRHLHHVAGRWVDELVSAR